MSRAGQLHVFLMGMYGSTGTVVARKYMHLKRPAEPPQSYRTAWRAGFEIELGRVECQHQESCAVWSYGFRTQFVANEEWRSVVRKCGEEVQVVSEEPPGVAQLSLNPQAEYFQA